MLKIAGKYVVKGLPKMEKTGKGICGPYQLGKQTRAAHKKTSGILTSKNLELLHMDLMGPTRTASLGGKRYILVIVDDFSRYTWAMLVFVLATFCWTKSLLCNVAAFTGMLLYPESTLQLCSSRRFCEVFKDLFRFPVSRLDDVVFRLDAHQSATSVWTTRSFRLDAHQCLEASNSSRLHPFGRNGKSSERSSEFEKIPVFQRIRPDDVVIPSGRHSVFDKK
jgi:hypothetical protein